MSNEEGAEDDMSLCVQKGESIMLKTVSGSKTYENLAEQRTQIDREPTAEKDEPERVPRVRRPSIVIREHQLTQYPINYDPSPQIIRKTVDPNHQPVVYKQQIAVRYLCPPTPPPPAPLIIREVRAHEPSPLPPIIIRQRPPAPATPPPIIIRERPPTPPSYTTPKIIYKRVSPVQQQTSRRVIIERLPPMPAKPPDIIVERWLPYKQQKRQVIYEKALPANDDMPPTFDQQLPNNVIIQYANPSVRIEKQMRSLGIVRCDPYGKDISSAVSSPVLNEPIYHNFSTSKYENIYPMSK
ncbi:unnamed protein product [Adineta ricciae]|uniref:Uncharacterized protein n=1 Tax=Adineta ricciae TaxID=249248 RepID=A0A816DLX8_ADIRI|nr:unnamed protein product [Adineta ricciae]